MPERGELTKETFLRMAEMVGLDTKDSEHMEILFPEVETLFGIMQRVDELDVSGEEPALIFHPAKE